MKKAADCRRTPQLETNCYLSEIDAGGLNVTSSDLLGIADTSPEVAE